MLKYSVLCETMNVQFEIKTKFINLAFFNIVINYLMLYLFLLVKFIIQYDSQVLFLNSKSVTLMNIGIGG